MECVDRYFEVLDRFLESLKEEENASFPPSDLTSSLITEDYFNKIDIAASLLYSFYDRNLTNKNIKTAVHSFLQGATNDVANEVKLFLLIDVFRCYKGLDHNTRINSPEGIALFVVLVKFLVDDIELKYEDLTHISYDLLNLNGIIPYIELCSSDLPIPKNEIVLSAFLANISSRLERNYRICLYRLSAAISEVDGIITEMEQGYINTLLHLDDDDVSNDIIVD